VDLKNKKNSKSRKKRKQNTEDEGKGRRSMRGAEREGCAELGQLAGCAALRIRPLLEVRRLRFRKLYCRWAV